VILDARAGRLAALALALFCGWLVATPALALRAVAGAVAAQEQPEDGETAERFPSPRAIGRALFGFYEYQAGENPAGLRRAAHVLDLGDLPSGQRQARGEFLVESRLSVILDKLVLLDAEASSFATADEVQDLQSWDWLRSPPTRPDLAVRLGFARQPEGGWLIDRDTVARLEGYYQQVKDLPNVAGLEGKPLTTAELVRRWVPDELEGGGILLETYQWIGLLVLVLLGVLVERIANLFLHPLLRRVSKRSGTIDEELLGNFERPVGALIATLVFLLLLPALDLAPRYRDVLELAASFVLAVAGVWATYRLVDVVCWVMAQKAAQSDNRFDDMLVPLVRRTLKVVVVIVGVVFVASRITTDLWGVFAGLSIGSLALGFAAKDSVENLFGTFTVLLDNPFKLGDVVQVGDLIGIVEQVGFRSTRVRTFEDALITVPNSRFIASSIENLSQRRRRRVNLSLGLTYDTPPGKLEAFCEGVRELVRESPVTFKDFYHVWFTGYGASSLDVMVLFFVDTTDHATYLREQHRINLDILRLAERLEVSFAFPTQTIHIAQPEDLAHGDVPSDLEAALRGGRGTGRQLSQASYGPFGGERPPPVRFDAADPDALGLGRPGD